MQCRRELIHLWTFVQGARIHARVNLLPAPAAKLVFIHGLGVSSRYVRPTMRRLVGEFSVMAPDLPGFGLSDRPLRALDIPAMADALVQWMRANGQGQAVLVGNSIGCQVAVDVACRYPEHVAGLILGAPTIDPAARSMLRQIGRVILDAPREAISLDFLAMYDYLEAGVPRVLATLKYALDDPIERKLPMVQAPTLVVAGQRDPIVPTAWARRVAELLPNGRLVVLPGVPHGMNYSTPNAFAGAIRQFMRTREESQVPRPLKRTLRKSTDAST